MNTRASLVHGQGDAQLLLAAGIIACPLFIGMSLIQALTRQGFDLKHYAISSSPSDISVGVRTPSAGKLAFLNNLVGVFESEIDAEGNVTEKVWEWK